MNHGSIKDRQRTCRPKSAGSEKMQMDIAQAFVENPHLSVRRDSDERDVAPETVQSILNVTPKLRRIAQSGFCKRLL